MNASHVSVRTAYATDSASDLDAISRLFDAYRAFYERKPDLEAERLRTIASSASRI